MKVHKADNKTRMIFSDSLGQLRAGLAYADSLIRWAVQCAHAAGLDAHDSFRGLYVSEEDVERLLSPGFATDLHADAGEFSTQSIPLIEARKSLDEQRRQWQKASEASRDAGVTMLFDTLIQRFSLSDKEVDAFLIALLPELDRRYERIFAYLQDDVTQKRPSVDLILNLLAFTLEEKLTLRRSFTPDSALIQSRLLQHFHDPAVPEPTLLGTFVRPAANVVEYLLGHVCLDEEVGGCSLLMPEGQAQPVTRVPEELLAQIIAANAAAMQPPLFAFVGAYGVGKEEAARHLAAAARRPLLRVDLAALGHSGPGLAEGMALALRDGRLYGAHLYLNGWDEQLQAHQAPNDLWQQLLAYPHTVIVVGKIQWQPWQHLGARPVYCVHFPQTNYQARLRAWQKHLGQNGHAAALSLPHAANTFQFTAGQIEDVAATALNRAQWQRESITAADIFAAGRAHSNQKLATLATKIQPRYKWQDIILPNDTLNQLKEMVAMVRRRSVVYEEWGFGQKVARGRGLAALFVGESGTGKTMAADIMAGELGLDLYKIDLSTLVSKYIGETEKNLERIFTEAATSNALLFFDEADAIFGKRSEVRDSHDRYANLEISYLLQRLELYEGAVILASNLQTNIDDAFTRRLHFIIEFPFPKAADRKGIWRANLPARTPLAEDVDFTLLAERFQIAGGNIRNIILAAAFLAAEANQPVGMPQLLHAARREYQKLGRLIDKKLFAVEAG